MKLRLAIGMVAAWVGSADAADPPPSTAAVTQVAIVYGRTCALHADGNVSCWGDNTRELFGVGTDPRTTPIGVSAFHDVVQLEGVYFGTCARLKDRTVTCLGMSTSSTAKLEVQPLTDVVALGGTCALHGNGEVSCFDGETWTRVAGIADASFVSGADNTGCVVRKDHTVTCWADPRNFKPTAVGAADDGSPKSITGVTDAVEVRAGMFFACARLRTGTVSCWGSNNDGQLGRGSVADATFAPALVPGLHDAVELGATAGAMCARRASGQLACWGSVPWDEAHHPSRPTEIKGLAHVTELAMGEQTCAVTRGRDVRCWGANGMGELGDGTGGVAVVARAIPGLRDAIQIDTSNLSTCALRRTGEIVCWGGDDKVAFGARKFQHVTTYWGHVIGLDREGATWVSGERTPRPVPKATAQAGPCLIANGGEMWCSANTKGPSSHNPMKVRVGDFTDAVELAGHESVCARHRTGEISCFHGWFETDNNLKIAGITDAITLAVDDDARCAVRADHSVWCWGEGVFLGQAPVSSGKPLPPARVNVRDVAAIAMGGASDPTHGEAACVIKLDGTVWCWGSNNDGRLGKLDRELVSKDPVAIRGATDATQIAVGWEHGCALQRAGTVVCWGSNEDGQLGTPSPKTVEHPVAVRWP